MSDWILYLLESNVLLALFYLLYVIMLRKETFFQFNRIFLVAIPVLSLLFPLLRIDLRAPASAVVERPIEEISKLRKSYYEAIALWEFENRARIASDMAVNETQSSLPPRGWIHVLSLALMLVYFTGVALCLSRTFWTLRSIRGMLMRYPREQRDGVNIIKTPNPTAPFSFLNYVFVHEPSANSPEFEQILAHERTHIREKHSIDLLFVQLAAAISWFNPVIWRLIRSLKTTHEYIADEKILNSGYSVTAYQALLLRQLISNNYQGLVHNFNLSFIKKRITMMTHKKSGLFGKIRVALTIACMILLNALIIQCNSKIDEQVAPSVTTAQSVSDEIDIPVLPPSGFRFDGDLSAAANFEIINNSLSINGKTVGLTEIAALLDEGNAGREVPIVMTIDKDQTMGFVRKLHMVLRKADRRKLLYMGKTASGERVEFLLVLPPDPDKVGLPDALKLHDEGKLDLLKIHLGTNDGVINQQKVYAFVKAHMAKGSDNYVVSAKMRDNDTYADFLVNGFYIKEGFHQIYQERSHDMFGKDFFKTTKEEYQAVRKNIPMAISIAED